MSRSNIDQCKKIAVIKCDSGFKKSDEQSDLLLRGSIS